jgi:hypothetical protein
MMGLTLNEQAIYGMHLSFPLYVRSDLALNNRISQFLADAF